MSHTVYETEMWVPSSLDKVWDFFSDATNLLKITPSVFGVEVDHSGETVNGAQVALYPKWLKKDGPLAWVAVYQDVQSSGDERSFTDYMKKGPLSHWSHTHQFISGTKEIALKGDKVFRNSSPGTWLKDRVEYKFLPSLVPGSKLIDEKIVKSFLNQLFFFRRKKLLKIFNEN